MSETAKHAWRIAGVIAGAVLLYLLYTRLGAAPTPAQTAVNATPEPGLTTGLDFPPQSGPNVYNVGAYNPTPTGGLALPGGDWNGLLTPLNSGAGGGCCDKCGPSVDGSGINQSIYDYTRFV